MVTHLSALAQAMPRNLPVATPTAPAQAPSAGQATTATEAVDAKLEPLT